MHLMRAQDAQDLVWYITGESYMTSSLWNDRGGGNLPTPDLLASMLSRPEAVLPATSLMGTTSGPSVRHIMASGQFPFCTRRFLPPWYLITAPRDVKSSHKTRTSLKWRSLFARWTISMSRNQKREAFNKKHSSANQMLQLRDNNCKNLRTGKKELP